LHVKPTRVIAVDWSGARTGAERKLWLAELSDGCVQRLEDGRSRAAMTEELVRVATHAARAGERVVIGLDFSFGFPAWYLQARGWTRGHEAWGAFTEPVVDALLVEPAFPFWGRGALRTRPAALREGSDTPPLRETERRLAGRARPFSVFQLVGAGAVGTASLRGMATLHALSLAGARVWPFDEDGGGAGAVVAEVWPRLAAPTVNKSSVDERVAHVQALTGVVHGVDACIPPVRASDDAFDALVAAVALWQARDALARMPSDSGARERLEGRIWQAARD
jgi:hypothetical protein